MKFFISHKKEDEEFALRLNLILKCNSVDSYLDLLDTTIVGNGKTLTDHIKNKLNDCTDIIVVMSEKTRYSQWVPFEVGMSAQIDMPTATFLQEGVELPSFLSYWPRLKTPSDIESYIEVRRTVEKDIRSIYGDKQFSSRQKIETERFYGQLKSKLDKKI